MATASIGSYVFANTTPSNTSAISCYSEDAAIGDFNGYNNTEILISLLGSNAVAASAAKNYTFKNGKSGYLMAAGEWQLILDNITEINSILTLLDKTTISIYGIIAINAWTSTTREIDSKGNWVVFTQWGAEGLAGSYSDSSYTVWPVTTL